MILIYNIFDIMQEVLNDIRIPEIKCPANKKARLSCIDSQCDKKAFICSDEKCDCCMNTHKQCKTGWINSLVDKMKTKRLIRPQGMDEAILKTGKIYEEALEIVTNEKNAFLAQMEYYGLNYDQIKLLKDLSQGRSEEIVGKSVHLAFRNVKNMSLFNRDEESLVSYWQMQVQKMKQIFEGLKNIRKSSGLAELDSKIIKNYSDKLTLQSFFQIPILSAKLKYRASENSYSTKVFHEKCDNVGNTLTLAQTDNGRIVGGFTPCEWKSQGLYIPDYSKRTFLFSIDNKEKYALFDFKNSIFGQADFGPTFGSGHDLHIPTNSFSGNLGAINLGNSFETPKGVENVAKHLFEKDSTTSIKFMEWQVFELKFVNPVGYLPLQKFLQEQLQGMQIKTRGTKSKRARRRIS